MTRAALCIGVNKPGLLTPLRAAASSAAEFGTWLKTKQYFDDVRVRTDSDQKRPVLVRRIKKDIAELVEKGPTQLVVYFSGHGVLNGQSETWLLSNVAKDPDEAVDLTASREQSRFCRVPNIVFISDACRALPTNLPSSSIRGASIFPTPTTLPGNEGETDIFFAAPKTGIALEIPTDSEKKFFKSLFTDVLLRSFINPPKAITLKLEEDGTDTPIVVVPNRRLRPILVERVLDEAEKYFPGRAPAPVLRLESGDKSYLGRAEFRATHDRFGLSPQSISKGLAHHFRRRNAASAVRITPSTNLRSLLGTSWRYLPTELNNLGWMKSEKLRIRLDEIDASSTVTDLTRLIYSKIRVASPEEAAVPERRPKAQQPRVTLKSRLDRELTDTKFKNAFQKQRSIDGRTGGFETRSGIEITGAKLHFAVPSSGRLGASAPGQDGRARWHFEQVTEAPASIAVGFEGGGTVVTCLPEFVTSITISGGRVVNISFVPARNGELWREYSLRADEINSLRAKVAAAARFGRLTVEQEDAKDFANQIRQGKQFDPTLGLYAAYAYAEISAIKDIQSVRGYMRNDMKIDLYDVALLASRTDPVGQQHESGFRIAPFCPMLSQGWSYALAYGIQWPRLLKKMDLLPSLWTTFDSRSIVQIANAMTRGGLK
jgi:hypothetical protein